MPKLTEADLDLHEAQRLVPRYPHTRPPLTLVRNFGGTDTQPMDRDHAPPDMAQGVIVHPMPAEACTDLQGDEPGNTWRDTLALLGSGIWRMALATLVFLAMCAGISGVLRELPRWTA